MLEVASLRINQTVNVREEDERIIIEPVRAVAFNLDTLVSGIAEGIKERQLRLRAGKARVARENEFIDRDLHKEDAETDDIKSNADVNRNISTGEKILLEKW